MILFVGRTTTKSGIQPNKEQIQALLITTNNSRIIEREYLDGRNGKIHLVTVLDYNKNGYLKTKYSGHGYLKDDSPEEESIFSKWDYNQEIINSFVFQTMEGFCLWPREREKDIGKVRIRYV